MNARTYPRTMAEAFPQTTLYACALERPAPNPYPRALWWVVIFAGAFALITACTS